MAAIDLFQQSQSQMLGTRPSARIVAPAMRAAAGDGDITLDTEGILRIGVSFFDEALLIFNEIVAETGRDDLRLVYRKAPTMQSLKNLVGNRGLTLSETDEGEWIIAKAV